MKKVLLIALPVALFVLVAGVLLLQRTQRLHAGIRQLQEDYATLFSAVKTLEYFDRVRGDPAVWMEELSNAFPPTIIMNRFWVTDEQGTIDGLGKSKEDVNDFVAGLRKIHLFNSAALANCAGVKNEKIYNFSLTFSVSTRIRRPEGERPDDPPRGKGPLAEEAWLKQKMAGLMADWGHLTQGLPSANDLPARLKQHAETTGLRVDRLETEPLAENRYFTRALHTVEGRCEFKQFHDWLDTLTPLGKILNIKELQVERGVFADFTLTFLVRIEAITPK